jgi:hypothetical protein
VPKRKKKLMAKSTMKPRGGTMTGAYSRIAQDTKLGKKPASPRDPAGGPEPYRPDGSSLLRGAKPDATTREAEKMSGTYKQTSGYDLKKAQRLQKKLQGN